MKQRIFLWSVCFLACSGFLAQDLENGDFELIEDCPPVFDFDTSIGQTMMNWLTVQGTADGYHEDCPAIEASATPNIPDTDFGNGHAGIWGPYEAFGYKFPSALEANTEYCLEFQGRLTSVGNIPEVEDSLCASICVYGSNELIEPDPWDFPLAMSSMPGTDLLGCSQAILNLDSWQLKTITFSADTTYDYLFFTGNQSTGCTVLQPYLCLDEITLAPCEVSDISEVDGRSINVFPNPSPGRISLTNLPAECTLRVLTVQGELHSEETLNNASHTLELPRGMWVIEVVGMAGASVQRVIVE